MMKYYLILLSTICPILLGRLSKYITLKQDVLPSRAARVQQYLMSNRGYYLKRLGTLLENEEKIIEKEKKNELNANFENSELNLYENLNLIFTIFKNIFFIADKEMIEMLLSDELYMITFGALECRIY